MFIMLCIFALVGVVCIFGTDTQEAAALYYDAEFEEYAEEYEAEMEESVEEAEDGEAEDEDDFQDVAPVFEDDGDELGGTASPKRRQSKEDLASLRKVAAAHDPMEMTAQQIFDDIRKGKM